MSIVSTRMIQGLFAILALTALFMAACAPTANTATPTFTRQSTPKAGLTWQQVKLPQGLSLNEAAVAISPVDGHDAWACVPATGGSFTIWATRDAGARWQQVSALTPATPEPARTCNLVADQYDTQSLVAAVSWGAGADGTLRSMSYFSSDSGAHMRALEGKMQTLEVGNASGATFAIVLDTDTTRGLQLAVIIGDSALLKWRAISPPGLAPNDGVVNFWTHLPDGTLFVATAQNAFWRSADGGTRWTRVSTAPGQVSLGAWLPQQGRWMFCASIGVHLQVVCSADGGITWGPRPTFDYTVKCSDCGKNGQPYSDTQTCAPTAITPDGSLLAACPATGTAPGDNKYTVYRLTPEATSWSVLGSAPSDFIQTTATGQMWAIDGQAGTISVADLPA